MEEQFKSFSARFGNMPKWQGTILIVLLVLGLMGGGTAVILQGENTTNEGTPANPFSPNTRPSNAAPLQLVQYQPGGVPTNQLLVQYGVLAEEANLIEYLPQAYDVTIVTSLPEIRTLVLSVRPGTEATMIDILKADPMLTTVERDHIAEEFYIPNDPSFSNQYGFSNNGQTIQNQIGKADADIDMTEAWDITRGNNVKIAVLDTGIDTNHPDFVGKVVASRDFSTEGSIEDLRTHGTHTAGIISSVTNNGTGVAGGCPDCKLMIGKVLNDQGKGAYSWIADGLIWAADNGAKVINMSLGGTGTSTAMGDAVNYAVSRGVVVVAAAGNAGSTVPTYPAYYAGTIAVAATDNEDNRATFSNYDAGWVDVAAPGKNIYAPVPNGYGYKSGTSMAAPMVAATAGLVWSTSYGTSAQAVRNRIESTAEDISGTGSSWKYGRVNAALAVGGTGGTNPTLPPNVPTNTPTRTPTLNPNVPTSTRIPTQPPTGPTRTPTPKTNAPPPATKTPTRTPTPGNVVKANCTYKATVTVQSTADRFSSGGPLAGATVTFTHLNPTTGKLAASTKKTCTTNASGTCSFSSNVNYCGTQKFTLSATKSGYTTVAQVRSVNPNQTIQQTLYIGTKGQLVEIQKPGQN